MTIGIANSAAMPSVISCLIGLSPITPGLKSLANIRSTSPRRYVSATATQSAESWIFTVSISATARYWGFDGRGTPMWVSRHRDEGRRSLFRDGE